jgi:predicted RNase H-like HicB family nuclease
MAKTITLTFEIEREGDLYVSLCRELDIASYGDSVEDAAKHLEEAVSLYLDVIEADGEREQVFRERGIRPEEQDDVDREVRIHPGIFATIKRVSVGAA